MAVLRAHFLARPAGIRSLAGQVLTAFALGIGSGISFPLGAMIGIYCAPISNRVNSIILAFGAGSLMFAVAVQMYGKTIEDFEHDPSWPKATEAWTTIIAGSAGALFFVCVDKWLDTQEHSEHASEATHGRETEALLPRPPDEPTGQRRAPRARTATVAAAASPQPAHGKAPKTDDEERIVQHNKQVAYALFVGLLIDGVPEGVFLGFEAAKGELTVPLVVSLFIANFPEACSSASLLTRARVGPAGIVGMWLALCMATGCLCGIVCWMVLSLDPGYAHGQRLPNGAIAAIASVEGFTGGAMMACICKVMIPEAAERAKDKDAAAPLWASTGLWCAQGFLFSTALEILFPAISLRSKVTHGSRNLFRSQPFWPWGLADAAGGLAEAAAAAAAAVR